MVEAGGGDGLHPIGGPHGIKVMGSENRVQQAPAIDVVIDDKNLGFHEGPPVNRALSRLARHGLRRYSRGGTGCGSAHSPFRPVAQIVMTGTA